MLAHSFSHWRRHSPRLKALLSLVLERSGRLKVLGQDGEALVRRHLDHMLARLATSIVRA